MQFNGLYEWKVENQVGCYRPGMLALAPTNDLEESHQHSRNHASLLTQMSLRQSLMRGTSTNGTLARMPVGKHWIRSMAGSSAPYLWRSPFGHTLGFTCWGQDKEKLNSTQWLREGYHAFAAQRDWLRLTVMSGNVDMFNGKCSMTNLLLEKSYDQEKIPFLHRIHTWAHGSLNWMA